MTMIEAGQLGQVVAVSGGSATIAIDAGQAHAAPVGGLVKLRVGALWAVASVRTLAQASGQMLAEIDFLGEGGEGLAGFRRGVTRLPVPGAPVLPIAEADLPAIYGAHDVPSVEIGTVHPTMATRAALLVDHFLGRHFALLGSTGTGKSTAAALILHRICDLSPDGHVVMIDPHGEYGDAFADKGVRYDAGNLEMPYWLMNFEEHVEVLVTAQGPERAQDIDILGRCLLAARGRNRLAEGIRLTVDAPVPYLLSDLSAALQAEMGKLDKGTSSLPYLRLKARLDEIRGDPRYGFMFSGMLVADTLDKLLARIFRLPAEGRPISVIDVSGVPSEITHVVVSVLARLVFDFALWSRGEATKPILFVCEEAHRYIPADTTGAGQSVRRILERIAKEGRKYGVSLGLITQRPSDLAEGVLSQCGTILSMRLNNERDQLFVKAAMPEGSRGFLDAIPALRNRECVVCGEGVSVAMRVTLDDLEEARRPASADPVFTTLWRETGGEGEMLGRTIAKWRGGKR